MSAEPGLGLGLGLGLGWEKACQGGHQNIRT